MSNKHKNMKSDFAGLYVRVNNNNINAAISLLKKKSLAEGLKKELRSRVYYSPKSEQRRRAKAAAKRRLNKSLTENKGN